MIIMNNNEEIFKYIKPYENDMLSKMKGFDLQDLIYYINNYYLELRNNLEIKELKENIGFGIEIECEKSNERKIYQQLNYLIPNWKIRSDNSLDSGTEVVSPILHDNKEVWKELEQVCNTIDKNAIIGENSGGHLHVGAQILNNDVYSLLDLKDLWLTYENIIYRFAYGEYLNPRKSIQKYAKPLNKTDLKKIISHNNKFFNEYDEYDFISEIFKSRYYYKLFCK